MPLLVVAGGVLLAGASPHRTVPFVWTVALAPMFLALDLALRHHKGTWWKGWLKVLGCTFPAGVVFAAITGGWVTNTSYVYGALPLPVAYGVNWFGYGGLFGLELFFFLGVPFALSWRRPWLAVLIVPLWCTVFQIYLPRFLFFTYGQVMISVPMLVQFADLLGSSGLNMLFVSLQMVLYFWVRRMYAPSGLSLQAMGAATAFMALLFASALVYGGISMERWLAREAAGTPVELAGIQPNFSLRRLASNPALSHSDREGGLRELLLDSAEALRRSERSPEVPTVLIWPESVYPRTYRVAREMRALVEKWVRQAGVHLLLASTDGEYSRNPDGSEAIKAYGVAIHVGPEGALRAVYRKIALIPFGETIPFADWFPGYRDLLKAWIPQISEFTPGTEHTVFRLENGVGIAPMICFDVAKESVARGMARNGARLGVVLANLAWFGRTTVSSQLGWYARFRAIENRMPLLFLSQNGESFLLDSTGREVYPRLPQFQDALFVHKVKVPKETSFYALHGDWVNRLWPLLLGAAMLAGWWGSILKRLTVLRRGGADSTHRKGD